MQDQGFGRRDFLKGAVTGAAAATATIGLPQSVQAKEDAAPATAQGYAFLNLDEAAFVEALVDHMVPADELGPKGTDIGINTYIDRALAGAWGKGDRLYMQGPWKLGVPSQGSNFPVQIYSTSNPNNTMATQTVTNTGGSQPHENRQPYLGTNMIVALQGVFPSQN